MDSRERYEDNEELFRASIRAIQASIYTCLPGHVLSFDAPSQTATVQIGVGGQITQLDGSVQTVPVTVIPDVPVIFPSGGGCTLTFPIKPNDECLIFFAARCIDGWHQSGGIQPPGDSRRHSLSDAFVLVGVRSRTNLLQNVSTTTTQLRSDAGETYVELNPSGHILNFFAPGGFNFNGGDAHFTGNVRSDADVLAGTVSLKNHLTTNVQAGSSLSGKPQQ